MKRTIAVIAFTPFANYLSGACFDSQLVVAERIKFHLDALRIDMLGDTDDAFLKKLIANYLEPIKVLNYRTELENYQFSFENAQGVRIDLSKKGSDLRSIIHGHRP